MAWTPPQSREKSFEKVREGREELERGLGLVSTEEGSTSPPPTNDLSRELGQNEEDTGDVLFKSFSLLIPF